MRLVLRTAALAAAAVVGATVVGVSGADAASPRARFAGAPLTLVQDMFLLRVTGPAVESQARYGVPASVIIAQAVHESGWGTSTLAATANNYFGMTCANGDPGRIAIGCRTGLDRTCDQNGCRRSTANFRVYRSIRDSFRDHGRQLATSRRYARAYARRNDPHRFISEMHRAGYATDPRYPQLIKKIMTKYGLYRYNRYGRNRR